MCARRFLIAVLTLTLLVVAAAFAIYQWGGSILLKEATPSGHFEPAKAGGAPDYRLARDWLARPDMEARSNPAEWRPSGWPPPLAARARVAVFFVHPTTYLERDRWNAPLEPGGQVDFGTRLIVQSQASAFNNVAEVWAPRYRQAAFGAFLLRSEDARKALDFAYADVLDAFDEFIKHVRPEQAIILAGHSQGALHLTRLLTDRRNVLSGRLIAAYVVGWPVSLKADLPAYGLPPCRAGEQTGCLLSWQTFAEPANPEFIIDAWQGTQGPTGAKRERADMLCVNPITGTEGGAAPPAANRGALVPTADLKSAMLQVGAVGAHCDKGLLILDGQPPPLGGYVMPGNNYHPYDYVLFWGSIARDAFRRTEAWLQR